jgi:thiamine-monophosphate kinase
VVTPGPLVVTITAFGRVKRGQGLTRAGACAGDQLWVTGTIGDGALGLLAAQGRLTAPALEKRYRLPQPRSVLGARLVGIASAVADVSDGLLADAGHIAHASRLAVKIERECVPLSGAAKRLLAAEPSLWANVLGGGDDYELVIAVPPRRTDALNAVARAAKVKVTRVGGFRHGQGLELMVAGRPVRVPRKGYVHF